MKHSSERLRQCLLSWLMLLGMLPAWAGETADDCLPASPDTLVWRQVDYVLQGDALIAGNRKIRLEGLVAPFPGQKHKWNQREPEPLARQARLFLTRLLRTHGMAIGIEYDEEKFDRFLRERAHLYYRDRDGRLHSIQAALLKAGLALAATEPPNLKHQRCYYAAERTARQAGRGVWRIARDYPDLKFPLIPSDRIAGDDTGYRIVRGPVRRITDIGDYMAINLDTTGLRIPKADFRRYWSSRMLRQLRGQTIEVRGRPYYARGHMYMIIRHPWQIDRLNPIYAAKIGDTEQTERTTHP